MFARKGQTGIVVGLVLVGILVILFFQFVPPRIGAVGGEVIGAIEDCTCLSDKKVAQLIVENTLDATYKDPDPFRGSTLRVCNCRQGEIETKDLKVKVVLNSPCEGKRGESVDFVFAGSAAKLGVRKELSVIYTQMSYVYDSKTGETRQIGNRNWFDKFKENFGRVPTAELFLSEDGFAEGSVSLYYNGLLESNSTIVYNYDSDKETFCRIGPGGA